jgi:hypothetical protein
MVVVAMVRLSALPFLRWCEKSVCGSDVSELKRDLGVSAGFKEWEVVVVVVIAESMGLPSLVVWGVPIGVPTLIVVLTD